MKPVPVLNGTGFLLTLRFVANVLKSLQQRRERGVQTIFPDR